MRWGAKTKRKRFSSRIGERLLSFKGVGVQSTGVSAVVLNCKELGTAGGNVEEGIIKAPYITRLPQTGTATERERAHQTTLLFVCAVSLCALLPVPF